VLLWRLVYRNAFRAPLRSWLTIGALAITFVAYVTIRAVSDSWTRQVKETPDNRVVSRHRIGWGQSFPLHYVAEVAALPGVKQAMGGHWMELKHPTLETSWFESTAVQAPAFLAMHYELVAPAEQKAAFLADRRGVFVSHTLAKVFGWKLGDSVHLKEPGALGVPDKLWEFTVRGLYNSTRHGFGERALWFHYEYLNEQLDPTKKDRIYIISAEISDPRQGATLARQIDEYFESKDDQTFTQEDQALNAAFVGMSGALIRSIDVLGLLLLAVIALLLGNSMAMSVRERITECGTLRALGFGAPNVLGFLLAEGVVLGFLGVLLGTAAAFPLVELGLGRYLQETLELSSVQIHVDTALQAAAISMTTTLLGAWLPSYRSSRLNVIECLRHAG
jgi:putative ABC transport system permease protein